MTCYFQIQTCSVCYNSMTIMFGFVCAVCFSLNVILSFGSWLRILLMFMTISCAMGYVDFVYFYV